MADGGHIEKVIIVWGIVFYLDYCIVVVSQSFNNLF